MKVIFRTTLAALALAAAALPAQSQQAPNVRNSPGALVRWNTVQPPAWLGAQPGMPATQHAARPVRPVPEPSQWALMGAGVGLVAWIVRRRSKRNKD